MPHTQNLKLIVLYCTWSAKIVDKKVCFAVVLVIGDAFLAHQRLVRESSRSCRVARMLTKRRDKKSVDRQYRLHMERLPSLYPSKGNAGKYTQLWSEKQNTDRAKECLQLINKHTKEPQFEKHVQLANA